VVAAHADLQDALIERPDRAWLGVPDQLQRLMTLEIFALVELLNPAQQAWGRRLAATARNVFPIRRIM
jgi:hypothetical protein